MYNKKRIRKHKHMKQDLVKKRNKIYCEVWEKYKNRIAMEDLAEMFNVSLKSFYRIVKEGRQDNQLTNN